MGLHQKSRDFLFREFVKRSYRDAQGTIQKTLLSIPPDEIAAMKQRLDVHTGQILDLTAFLGKAHSQRRQAETDALELLRRFSRGERAAFFLLQDSRKALLGPCAGAAKSLPTRILLDPDLFPVPVGREAVLPVPADSPLAHDLRRQHLKGHFAVFFRSRKPTSLLFWTGEGCEENHALPLLFEILALLRGDRALPAEVPRRKPVKKAADRGKKRPAKRKKKTKATKRILPSGILDGSDADTAPLNGPSSPSLPKLD